MSIGRVGVIGLGFVGLSLAVALASRGFKVVGIDVDSGKIELIRHGRAPFYEKGLEELLRSTIGKHLIVSTDYELLRDVDIVFITVGTPSKPSGEQDQSQIVEAVKELASAWRDSNGYKVMVVKSTVIPGTTRRLAKILADEAKKKVPEEIGVAANPEFLREGNALYDTFYPSRVVIGGIDDRSSEAVAGLWRKFYRRIGVEPPILVMSLEEAELVKYASNAFLAMRISFANTIANICENTPNCDVVKVLEGVGLDPRIGKEYLRPGLGYGGSCLPKDVKALINYSRSIGYNPVLLEAIDKVNEMQPYRAVEYLLREYYSDLQGKVISILGLAFKPGTDDVRESVALKIAKKLVELGAKVKVHDPIAIENARKILGDTVMYCQDTLEAIKNSDAVIITTEWNVYKELKPEHFKKLMRKPVVIDGRRIYDPKVLMRKGVKVYAIGLNIHHTRQ